MYKIYADKTLIYDSTIEDYKIGKGQITREVNKSGSFTFSLYPDHFYYDKFIRMKTVITVYKAGQIVFRGRVLNDVTDYWNNKVLTCEGELGFLQDSIIRPFSFEGTPADLFYKFIEDHNAQVDDFKKFKLGRVTVVDPNDYIARSNSAYESAFNNLSSRLLTDSLGGYLYITHGENGAEDIPTLNYLADFEHISSQNIEFGSNLKNYTKTESADSIVTAIIPLGAEIDDGDDNTENKKLTIESVNGGKDYVYHEAGVALYGWIIKSVEWDDVTLPENLKTKAEQFLEESVNHNITVELNAIDLHLLDRSIESFKIGDYVRVISSPHNFKETLLCQKQTIDLLKPDNDTITLGHTRSTFTSSTTSTVETIKSTVDKIGKKTNSYKVAEQKLTSLMAQSFGVFRTIEKLADGSEIYYIHDSRSLDESKTIWKMTENAFAVSTDGGQTWNAGLDAEGNVLVNVLSAIGINFDWASGGTLLLGGLDNECGKFVLQDKNGDTILTINNEGIVMTMNDGSKIVINPELGFYQMIGSNKREYHNLFYTEEVSFPAMPSGSSGISSTIITLPDEFKNKKVNATIAISELVTNNVPSSIGAVSYCRVYCNPINQNRVEVFGCLEVWDLIEQTMVSQNEHLHAVLTVTA